MCKTTWYLFNELNPLISVGVCINIRWFPGIQFVPLTSNVSICDSNRSDVPLVWYEGAAVSTATRRYLHANWQGSIAGIAQADGTIIAINGYDAYGIGNETNIGRFQYTGQA